MAVLKTSESVVVKRESSLGEDKKDPRTSRSEHGCCCCLDEIALLLLLKDWQGFDADDELILEGDERLVVVDVVVALTIFLLVCLSIDDDREEEREEDLEEDLEERRGLGDRDATGEDVPEDDAGAGRLFEGCLPSEVTSSLSLSASASKFAPFSSMDSVDGTLS